MPLAPAPDKDEEQRSGRQNGQRDKNVEKARIRQPFVVKGDLGLQPADKNAEGARAADVTGFFQSIFLHIFHLAQIE